MMIPLALYQHQSQLEKDEKSKMESDQLTVSLDLLKQNFEKLKDFVILSVGLQLFNVEKPVFIYTDSSDLGADGLNMQADDNHDSRYIPIAFFSKSFI
ncbi:hypothetical protein C6P40_003689 [Pichia californica]|uniref:Reverse transcriptase/retrotransposon-derived protein RNase H-like domain-containing protein n=1 Tax=Pichia californica TaxID=460514 RepID=A0A9P7BEF6_9ASCO|nr:hypothetical protein C6P40_003689 [[Candida] californica]